MMATGTPMVSDAARMELRSYVQLAAEAVAHYWPMRTFIHHNPLHGLEELPFDQAVKRGDALFGGRGYLPNADYRSLFEQGVIRDEDLDEVLGGLVMDKQVVIGGRVLTHREILRLSMVHGVGEAAHAVDPATQSRVSAWLNTCWGRTMRHDAVPLMPWEPIELPTKEMLSRWCDRTLGSRLVSLINEQMIKWCSAFLDEGEAPWAMPNRELTFYRAWKKLAPYDASLRMLGMVDAPAKIAALADRPEEGLLASLLDLKIPKSAWESYLALHLAALPGWAGYIKWRSEEAHHPWQTQYPIDLVKYLAVRLFYERELVAGVCTARLGLPGHAESLVAYMTQTPYAYWAQRELEGGTLPSAMADDLRALTGSGGSLDLLELDARARQWHEERVATRGTESIEKAARQVMTLAAVLGLEVGSVMETNPSDIMTVLDWLDGFPASQHASRWLEALEARRRRHVAAELSRALASEAGEDRLPGSARPLSQVVFCIDVRSEVFRRHVEQLGGYETLGLAGFFGIPLDYQAFGAEHQVTHCPVLIKPKNHIREVPRSYHGRAAELHHLVDELAKMGHALLHDLKENVITPYVMVEAVGWFFGVPLFAKTLCPLWYGRLKHWLTDLLLPPVATTLTIDKLTRAEAAEMLASEQRVWIRNTLRKEFGIPGSAATPALIEAIRLRVLDSEREPAGLDLAARLGLSPTEERALFERVRREFSLTPREMSRRLDRITQHGFSVAEQAYGVEAALRLMGLTSNFARLVVFCAHGSTSENNPYESALDCGACGGNHGLPNARAFAAMANRPMVRELLAARGIVIPHDTHFLAAEHDTTSDEVRIVDMEDVPATHRKDLTRLLADLEEAGAHAALERGRALDPWSAPAHPRQAKVHAKRRSLDWAQVRPEWGLSRNSLLIVGRREMTSGLNLGGRSFLHSYDYRQDESGKLLETIMTAPLVVAQWINMEHYFSTVDNEVYGSGSKVYHNVVGRVGVMSGVSSDLRIGLPAQTVLNGPNPYHEPMRLLAVIEAPRERIRRIILRHPLLERLFDHDWVSLIALDPQDRALYHYETMTGWTTLEGGGHGRIDAASYERD